MQRNFICPETEEPCTSGACAKGHFCEREVQGAIERTRDENLSAKRRDFRFSKSGREAMDRLLHRKPKISN